MQIKTYIYWYNQINPEVHRFVIEDKMSTKFIRLASQLHKIYPILKLEDYKVSWKDEDGDYVTISSDEEIEIALTCMTDNVKKFNVHCLADKPLQKGLSIAVTDTRNNTTVLKPNGPEDSIPLQKPVSLKDDELNMSINPPKIEHEQLQQEKLHIKKHIDEAIKKMISMGFTNNDGWITQLLETTNGDIAPVIELLSPVNTK